MTCKDCIHYDVCQYHITEETDMTVAECSHTFKNKADFVEVVRCKGCKHWRRKGFDPIFEKEFGYCYNDDFPFMCETRPDVNEDDFCSYGERKKNDKE